MNVASTSRRLRANRRPSTTAAMLGRTAPGAGGIGRDQQQRHDRRGERDDVDHVGGGDARDREDDPADRGPDDRGAVEHQLVERRSRAGSRSDGTSRGIADARAGWSIDPRPAATNATT